MNAVRFHAVIGEDRVIQLPRDVKLTPGRAEVIVLQEQAAAPPPAGESLRRLVERLGQVAEELGVRDLPTDLAENHDHYAHGAPKGIDRP